MTTTAPVNASCSSSAVTSARPTVSLSIPPSALANTSEPPQLSVLTPLSPIAFDFPGPRELRKRREDELDRRMKDLGFVEAPPPSAKSKAVRAPPGPAQSHSRPSRHAAAFSVSSAESDDGRDVVLLVDPHSDSETDLEDPEPPTRSESRAAMLTLFADVDTAPSPLAEFPPDKLEVDVQVEIVSKKAAARTKRRYSRKWVREKSGKRWTEKDFSEVLAQLRKLR
ncbi:hypothetical protein C8Q77DRAFT_447084 [Trametes polyzona]|nr:hypothetical protein C8Q77DRAFT_447084 [Trametes polyzona]